MELDLISSMHRAFYFHKKEQIKEGFNWEQWQKSKLRAIEEYRKRNKKILKSYKKPIRECVNRELKDNYSKGQNRFASAVKRLIDKFKYIKEIIRGTYKGDISIPRDISSIGFGNPPADKDFFGINEKKLAALQKSVHSDIKKANSSILRKMDDVYRQTIYKSHVYLQSGAVTLDKAIDMATKDFLNKGIDSIVYSNGAHVNIASYAEMCLRTANHRAMLLGEGSKRDEYNIHLVVCSAHANTCKLCEPWQGKILIDDVFSHPSEEYINEYIDKYPLLSEAIKSGLLHPNCRHSLSTFFEGVTTLPKVPDGKDAVRLYEEEQKQRALERKIRQQKRIIAGTCDENNINIETKKLKYLEKQIRELLKNNPQLKRNREREKPAGISREDILKNLQKLKEIEENVKIEEIRSKIKSGEQPLTIEEGKQGKHIKGHNNYIEGRSYLTISLEEAQELVNKYAGTGEIRLKQNGEWDNKEIIKVDNDIGVNINNKTNESSLTNKFKIHYSKKGVHIVPTKKE